MIFKLEIHKIQNIFKVKIGKFIYKCLNKTIPIDFHDWFILTTEINNHNTRSKFMNSDQLINIRNLFIPTARTSHYGLKKLRFMEQKYGMHCHLI